MVSGSAFLKASALGSLNETRAGCDRANCRAEAESLLRIAVGICLTSPADDGVETLRPQDAFGQRALPVVNAVWGKTPSVEHRTQR